MGVPKWFVLEKLWLPTLPIAPRVPQHGDPLGHLDSGQLSELTLALINRATSAAAGVC